MFVFVSVVYEFWTYDFGILTAISFTPLVNFDSVFENSANSISSIMMQKPLLSSLGLNIAIVSNCIFGKHGINL